jgi:hypothetical protein
MKPNDTSQLKYRLQQYTGCNVEVFKDYLRLAQTMYDYYILRKSFNTSFQ